MSRLARSRPVQTALVVLLLGHRVSLVWWRGPDWGLVYHAFDFVNWAWVVSALVLNLASVVVRALAWQTDDRAGARPAGPPFNRTFSAFAVGLLGNAALPGRIGELARVAVLRRRLPMHGPGTSAALVGTVFAHRLFDLFPALVLVGYVLATAKIPHWAVTSLVIVSVVGITLFVTASRSRGGGTGRRSTARGPCATCSRWHARASP